MKTKSSLLYDIVAAAKALVATLPRVMCIQQL